MPRSCSFLSIFFIFNIFCCIFVHLPLLTAFSWVSTFSMTSNCLIMALLPIFDLFPGYLLLWDSKLSNCGSKPLFSVYSSLFFTIPFHFSPSTANYPIFGYKMLRRGLKQFYRHLELSSGLNLSNCGSLPFFPYLLLCLQYISPFTLLLCPL